MELNYIILSCKLEFVSLIAIITFNFCALWYDEN
jgi:hypothetical protein